MGGAILLVDDSAEDCELLLLAFREIGFRRKIVVARDGREALDYLFGVGVFAGRDRTETPLLAILDLKMPGIDGLEVLRVLRADSLLKYLLVMVLTSSDEERDRTEAFNLGVNLYVTKPPDFDGYLKLARQIDGLLSGAS